MSWLNFKDLLRKVFEHEGYAVITNDSRSVIGGDDFEVTIGNSKLLVQCKHWKAKMLTVSTVQEHINAMTFNKVSRGIIVCSGQFSDSAIKLARDNAVELIDGKRLAKLVEEVQHSEKQRLAEISKSKASYACPKCGGSMTVRPTTKGRNTATNILWCTRYPSCQGMTTL